MKKSALQCAQWHVSQKSEKVSTKKCAKSLQFAKLCVPLHSQPHKSNKEFAKSKKKSKKEMKNTVDLRTAAQVERDKRDAAICKAYATIRAQQPLVSRNRVLWAVAKEYGLVGMTVKGILRKYNAYN